MTPPFKPPPAEAPKVSVCYDLDVVQETLVRDKVHSLREISESVDTDIAIRVKIYRSSRIARCDVSDSVRKFASLNRWLVQSVSDMSTLCRPKG